MITFFCMSHSLPLVLICALRPVCGTPRNVRERPPSAAVPDFTDLRGIRTAVIKVAAVTGKTEIRRCSGDRLQIFFAELLSFGMESKRPQVYG